MCGVIGLVLERHRADLGKLAAGLLRMLEYRGYDSTGAVFQKESGKTVLKKDVGAPSELVKRLGIEDESGRIFCGQVRWATFGAVNRENAQPHEVRCKTHVYGAHNGNITNCDTLKEWLIERGHEVKSDNDGEMLVHTVEHFFAKELQLLEEAGDQIARAKALAQAVVAAAEKLVGSFAAVIVDPESGQMAAIKAGSSFYAGLGHNEEGGSFVIASSDLGSVLSMTKILLPVVEGEFIIAGHKDVQVYDLKSGDKLVRKPARSLLATRDTQLHPPFQFFMEQEIYSQGDTARRLLRLYTGESDTLRFLARVRRDEPKLLAQIYNQTRELAAITDFAELREGHETIASSRAVKRLAKMAKEEAIDLAGQRFTSSMGGLLDEILRRGDRKTPESVALNLIDALFELYDHQTISEQVTGFVEEMAAACQRGGKIYMLACGTSFHAAKIAGIFFNEIANIQVLPLLPGEFRAQALASIRDGDVLIGISQSGETKDLIDIFNHVEACGVRVTRISIVNNVNSTLAQEKAKLYIPLCCGPEIAVPATKSFINQLLALYYLALQTMVKLAGEGALPDEDGRRRRFVEGFNAVPLLIDKTLNDADSQARAMAADLFYRPSMHILATRLYGVALEGALKVREVVLNHTQGYESSEFKHGPNTILGLNTIFGIDLVSRLMDKRATLSGIGLAQTLYANYPLVFVTGPDELDINLTISQVNTHKIRGADIYMIAEPDEHLYNAVAAAPATGHPYRWQYLQLPKTGDSILPVFSSTVVLQLLALRMSVLKKAELDSLGIEHHGVHPDSPKNVSKSITVD